MYIDKQLKLSAAQAVTASAASENYINLGAAGDLGLADDLQLMINVTTAADAVGSATVTFSLQCDDNTSFSSAKTVLVSDAIGKATLVAGYTLFLPIPVGLDEKYMRLYYTVATGPLTAGNFDAQVVHGIQKSKAYPDAL